MGQVFSHNPRCTIFRNRFWYIIICFICLNCGCHVVAGLSSHKVWFSIWSFFNLCSVISISPKKVTLNVQGYMISLYLLVHWVNSVLISSHLASLLTTKELALTLQIVQSKPIENNFQFILMGVVSDSLATTAVLISLNATGRKALQKNNTCLQTLSRHCWRVDILRGFQTKRRVDESFYFLLKQDLVEELDNHRLTMRPSVRLCGPQ